METFIDDKSKIPPCLECCEKTILWRYMSFSSLCEILMYNYIPLIRSDLFEDKSEGVIFREVIRKMGNTNPAGLDYAIECYKESTYISSWHISEHESAAMWDKYTHGKDGVAIKTNAMKLIHSIDNSEYENSARKIKEVIYTDENPSEFSMDEDLLEEYYYIFFFYKMKDFEYEKEVRILISLFHNPHSLAPLNSEQVYNTKNHMDDLFKNNPALKNSYKNKKTHNMYIDSSLNLIDEIVLSPYSHKVFNDIVKQFLKLLGIENRIKVSQSCRSQWV